MKLLLIIDKPYHNELKDYLISLKGINDVKISNDNYLEVNINYDNKTLTMNFSVTDKYFLSTDLRDDKTGKSTGIS